MAKIEIEVAYALQHAQRILNVEVHQGATVLQAIRQSGILQHFPEIDLQIQKVGIFSKICALDQVVCAGDRIEIYRPLTIDPKEARRAKAKNKTRV